MKRPFMNLRWRLLARARETLTKPDRRYIMASNHNTQGNQGNQGSNDGHTKSASQGGQGTQGSNKQSDTSNRGFASMNPDQQREIASEGGKAAHAAGTAHEFTSEEARKAGSMSHKNDGNQQSGSSTGGSQNSGSGGNQGSSGSTRGGTPEQHAEAGRQSHKNDR